MLLSSLGFALSLMLAQAPPVNVACAVLTSAQVTSLIGAAKTRPMGDAPNGSSCMFQNEDKVITVLVATNTAADAAQRLFDAKKRIATGTDIAGWGVPAYGAALKNVATTGVLKQLTFVEVKVSDSKQKPEAMAQVLQAAMKEFTARK
jgi:hypothetical protein